MPGVRDGRLTTSSGPEDPATYTRRGLLAVTGTSLTLGALIGCDALSTSPRSGDTTSGPAGGGRGAKEAPQLAAQVKAGNLPPRDKRLPAKPMVIKPVERIGSYGGTYNTFVPDKSFQGAIGYEPLVRWTRQWHDIMPNVAESWQVHDGGRRYTFTLRKGMKWSDGQPFTSDDVAFAYDDVLSDADLFPQFPDWLIVEGEPGKFRRINPHSFEISFAAPHAFFLYQIASDPEKLFAALPKHYLRKFHQKYNAEVGQVAKDAGFDSWTDLFLAKGGGGIDSLDAWMNTELPVLLPWRVTIPPKKTRLVAERNPYYWKVDPEGNQLPYIDTVVIELIPSVETAELKIAQGSFSLPRNTVLTLQQKPVLARNQESGGYHLVDQHTSDQNHGCFCFNLTHPDRAMREMFQNRDFRIGLSYAINRPELIDAVLQRQGKPYQSAPRPESDFYLEMLATQYTEHDVRKANDHLDRAGYARRDASGNRLGPAGEPVSFTVEFPTTYDPTYADICDLVRGYWAKVGVTMRPKSESGSLYWERLFANQHDAVIFRGEGGLRDAILPGEAGWFFPVGSRCYYARQWADWYASGGKDGEEPPEPVKRQMELYDRVRTTPAEGPRRDLFMKILEISQQEFYVVGTALVEGAYDVVQNNFHNVPNPTVEGSLYPEPAAYAPEQFYVSA